MSANLPAVVNPSSFALMQDGAIEDMTDAINENLAGGTLSLRHLTAIKMPAAGSTVWQVPTAGGEENVPAITGIIILQQPRRVYYEKSMAEADGENNRPNCFSNDAKVGVGVRWTNDPEGTGPHDCAACPLSKFGQNNERPRCQLRRNLYVLREQDMMPVVIDLPPTSIKQVEGYMAGLMTSGVRYSHAVTEIGLQKAMSKGGARSNPYSEATFKQVGVVDRSERPKVNDYKEAIVALVSQPTPQATGDYDAPMADPSGDMEDIDLDS